MSAAALSLINIPQNKAEGKLSGTAIQTKVKANASFYIVYVTYRPEFDCLSGRPVQDVPLIHVL